MQTNRKALHMYSRGIIANDGKTGEAEKRRLVHLATFWLSVILALAAILGAFFYNALLDTLTPFSLLICLLALTVLLVVFIVVAIVLLLAHRKEYRVRLVPIAVILVSILLAVLIPFRDLGTRIDFILHKNDAVAVVQDISSGHLEPSAQGQGMIATPYYIGAGYEISTCDDNVWEIKGSSFEGVYFCTRGFLDNESGYLYVKREVGAEHAQSEENEFFLGELGLYHKVIDLRDGWYYISSVD